MPPSVQGLRGTARGLRSHGHPRHDPLDAPPPRAPKPKAPTGALTFKTGSDADPACRTIPCQRQVMFCPDLGAELFASNPSNNDIDVARAYKKRFSQFAGD